MEAITTLIIVGLLPPSEVTSHDRFTVLYTAIDKAITKTKGRKVQEYVFSSMVLANIYVQG